MSASIMNKQQLLSVFGIVLSVFSGNAAVTKPVGDVFVHGFQLKMNRRKAVNLDEEGLTLTAEDLVQPQDRPAAGFKKTSLLRGKQEMSEAATFVQNFGNMAETMGSRAVQLLAQHEKLGSGAAGQQAASQIQDSGMTGADALALQKASENGPWKKVWNVVTFRDQNSGSKLENHLIKNKNASLRDLCDEFNPRKEAKARRATSDSSDEETRMWMGQGTIQK